MKIFASDMGFPEAPVLLDDGSFLFVEMDPSRGCVTHISADGSSRRTIGKTGRPNGLAMDKTGNIWIAETAQQALVKMDMSGHCEVIADNWNGLPFLFLNDLAIGPDGYIYMTDSGVLMKDIAPDGELVPHYRDLDFDGRVYRIDPSGNQVQCIDRGLLFTNGIAFGPDGALYIAETLTGNIYRYTDFTQENAERTLWGNVIENFDPQILKGPDGMKFAADGSLYACVFGQGDVTVLDRHGAVLRRIKTDGMMPTNLVFGPDGQQSIYVTEVETGTVQIYEVGENGYPLFT